MDFVPFPKIARLSREVIVSEKLDGTNAQVFITNLEENPAACASLAVADVGSLRLYAGSRTKWITPEDDNYGFAKWVKQNAEELVKLGPGNHFGEWWGQGIQRNYGLQEKRWSLFNVSRWLPAGSEPELISSHDPKAEPKYRVPVPPCCHVVPTLGKLIFSTVGINALLEALHSTGSLAAPGFMKPEGIVIYHPQGNVLFKKILLKDEEWKGKTA